MIILERSCWIFDMDGTLTVAAHDFDAIREHLKLPAGRPILESLAELPERRRQLLLQRLDAIELEIAKNSQPQPGAVELLSTLARRGARLGVLTRNSEANAAETLRASGLARFFSSDCIVGRESAAPKPSPEGILALLHRWQAPPAAAVMVGDYLFDLMAGRSAGTATVYLDVAGTGQWSEHADATVGDLGALLAHAAGPARHV